MRRADNRWPILSHIMDAKRTELCLAARLGNFRTRIYMMESPGARQV